MFKGKYYFIEYYKFGWKYTRAKRPEKMRMCGLKFFIGSKSKAEL